MSSKCFVDYAVPYAVRHIPATDSACGEPFDRWAIVGPGCSEDGPIYVAQRRSKEEAREIMLACNFAFWHGCEAGESAIKREYSLERTNP